MKRLKTFENFLSRFTTPKLHTIDGLPLNIDEFMSKIKPIDITSRKKEGDMIIYTFTRDGLRHVFSKNLKGVLKLEFSGTGNLTEYDFNQKDLQKMWEYFERKQN